MWKPWILAAIGSIMIINVTAKVFDASTNTDAALASSYFDVENSSTWNGSERRKNRCAAEIEKACGPKVFETKADTGVISKKTEFKGTTGNERADLVNSIRSAIGKQATPLPGNFGTLCTNVNANIATDMQETTMEGVDGIIAAWKLPQEVSSFFANLKKTVSKTYQTYRFVIQSG
jgi:hypothetical protein